jgi:glucose/arabinose dehydrogenase
MPIPSNCTGVPAARFPGYGIADGWTAVKLLGGIKQPRAVLFDPAGNLLVLQATKGVSVHTFGPDGCIASTTMLISNPALNHGLSLTPDGKMLYASSETTVWSWSYDAAAMKATGQTAVVKGISTGIHSTRTLAVVPQKPNLLLVQAGSNANWDYDSGSPTAGRSGIKIFDVSAAPSGGWSYNTDGYQFGYGLRNEVGFTFDPNGMVWGVENSGDVSEELNPHIVFENNARTEVEEQDFQRTIDGTATDIHTDNPAEELNYREFSSDASN